ncbi:MAG: carboxypeptidase regulatory-like domain-containing protein, partial [Solirubrobacterales bacterium]|nr:carboxypeptidase regulatory-like domain-containing protein [Solirubrobacterales bacterium]
AATITCTSGYSSKTGSTGNYSIPNVSPGSYSCTASASGYRPSTRNVVVSAGQTSTANFTLTGP